MRPCTRQSFCARDTSIQDWTKPSSIQSDWKMTTSKTHASISTSRAQTWREKIEPPRATITCFSASNTKTRENSAPTCSSSKASANYLTPNTAFLPMSVWNREKTPSTRCGLTWRKIHAAAVFAATWVYNYKTPQISWATVMTATKLISFAASPPAATISSLSNAHNSFSIISHTCSTNLLRQLLDTSMCCLVLFRDIGGRL